MQKKYSKPLPLDKIVIAVSILFSLPPLLCGFFEKEYYLERGVKILVYLPDFYMKYLLLLAVSSSLFLFFIFKKDKQFFFSKVFIGKALIVFAVWALTSFLWAHNIYESSALFSTWAIAFLAYFIVLNFFRSDDYVKILLFTIFISGFLISIFGILQNVSESFNNILVQAMSPASTFSNRNLSAHYILLTFPLGIGFFLKSKNKNSSLFFAIATSLMVAYLIYTISKAAYLSLFVQIVFIIFFTLKKKISLFKEKKSVLLFAIALFLVFAFSAGKSGNTILSFPKKRIVSLFEKAEEKKGFLEKAKYVVYNRPRTKAFIATSYMIKDNFVKGVGIGNWYIHYPFYANYFKKATVPFYGEHKRCHNEYLEIFADLGIIGFIVFIWIGFSIFIVGKKLLSNKTLDNFFLFFAIITALIGISIDALFSFPFRQPMPIFIILIYLAILDLSYLKESSPAFKIDIRRAYYIIGSLAFLIISIFTFNRLEKAELSTSRARGGWYNNLPEVMLKEGNIAYKLSPFIKENIFFIGSSYLKRGEYEKAKHYFKKSFELYPNRQLVVRGLSFSYFFTKEYQKAEKLFTHFLYLSPKDDFVRSYLAETYLINKKYNKALKEFKFLAKNHPEELLYQKKLGLLFYKYFNDKEQGMYYFKRALNLTKSVEERREIKTLIRNFAHNHLL